RFPAEAVVILRNLAQAIEAAHQEFARAQRQPPARTRDVDQIDAGRIEFEDRDLPADLRQVLAQRLLLALFELRDPAIDQIDENVEVLDLLDEAFVVGEIPAEILLILAESQQLAALVFDHADQLQGFLNYRFDCFVHRAGSSGCLQAEAVSASHTSILCQKSHMAASGHERAQSTPLIAMQ